ncbi:hypothetical protein OHS71_09395 [Streptomyces sp. NBC_00377]|uniref:hypothetical protein n=1 Tax=unclassified Streptomyces TaxID=2593676 RepID=UPI002E20030F|nr:MULTISPECIES: hypothetical protein [unclassified Streptomyces]
MTTPPTESLLFDVPPLTPLSRLLRLADQYTRHNDALDGHDMTAGDLRHEVEPVQGHFGLAS